ncbi:hypothetical protein T05_10136 [Trichinella murrelli]|uniref:Uncharacterized protein n=1 Tax=Trichinella murrelli TaxID=144512 RepID=A0A0V0SXI3_9BILA|nr:hypothetical protein T05_10136 [Trichinella murrelli]
MDKMCTLYVSNCNQEQVKYLRMFVMPHLQQTDVNLTKHGGQSERNLKTAQLMMLYVIIDIHKRHTETVRKRFYVHANTGCKRYKLHGMT